MFRFRITLGGSGASSTRVRSFQGNSERRYLLIFHHSTGDCVTCNAVWERNTRTIRWDTLCCVCIYSSWVQNDIKNKTSLFPEYPIRKNENFWIFARKYFSLSSEIVQRVKTVESPPFRPKVPSNAADRKILDLMRMCWEEIPMFRPNFATIVSVLKQANNGRFVVHL